MLDYVAIGKRIRALRKDRGMTQDELRYAVDISKAHMSHIETGATKVSLPTLVDIANALETTVDYLVSDSIIAASPLFEKEIEELLKDCSPYEYGKMIEAMSFIKDIIGKRNDGE